LQVQKRPKQKQLGTLGSKTDKTKQRQRQKQSEDIGFENAQDENNFGRLKKFLGRGRAYSLFSDIFRKKGKFDPKIIIQSPFVCLVGSVQSFYRQTH
jgi:hypothetical protein